MAHSQSNFPEILKFAEEVALGAGRILLEGQKDLGVATKPDGSLVTNMDAVAEKFIIRTIRKKFPEHGFLGEETGKSGNQKVRWIIDPVDGTENYSSGMPDWSVMLALQVNGRILLGVIYDPVKGVLYSASYRGGAFRNDRQMMVSSCASLAKSSLLYSSAEKILRSAYGKGFRKLLQGVCSSQEVGDCPGWMLIAEGKADIGFHFWLGPEDIAAPRIIIEEAGGSVTDLRGRKSIHSGHALATNGKLHSEVLQLISSDRE